jgi:pyruvate formate lyase activating enzyme
LGLKAKGEEIDPLEGARCSAAVSLLAIENQCEGVGFSYNEPTIFIEYVIDAAREAHRRGRYTVFVTNGYGTVESVRAIKGYVDAVVVDYKGSGEQIFQRRQTMTVSAEQVVAITSLEVGMTGECSDSVITASGLNRL